MAGLEQQVPESPRSAGSFSDEAKKLTGSVIYTNNILANLVIGKNKRWGLVILTGLGTVISLGWFLLSILASLNSDPRFRVTTQSATNFTVFYIVLLTIFILFVALVTTINSYHFTVQVGTTVKKNVRGWSFVAVDNRRRVKGSVILQIVALSGLAIVNITFLSSRLQLFGTYFSDIMYDVHGLVSTYTALSTSTNACDMQLVAQCNSGATYEMHDITAQSFVNTNHVNIVLTWMLYFSFLFQFLAFIWLEVAIPKVEDHDGLSGFIKTSKEDINISPPEKKTAVWLYVGQSSSQTSSLYTRAGARNDTIMSALQFTYIFAIVVLMLIWFFQLVTAAGILNSLCSFFDGYGGFWLIFISLLWAFIVVIGFITMGINIKDVILNDTTNMQKFKILFTALFLVLLGVLEIVLGGIWVAEHGTATFAIPNIILCRVSPYWRTYNALKVLEATIVPLAIFTIIEVYFVHTSFVARIYLLRHAGRSKNS